MRTFIAFAFATIATLSTARAADQKQTVEADNGAIYEILHTSVIHSPNGKPAEAHAQVLTPDNEQIHFVFDCRGHMVIPSAFTVYAPIRAIPPRSVAAGIAQIACTGHQ